MLACLQAFYRWIMLVLALVDLITQVQIGGLKRVVAPPPIFSYGGLSPTNSYQAMNFNPVYKSLFCEVHNLLRLYWTVPITTYTSERSFSALRQLLTYLRSTISELRLNNCILLHVHKALMESLDIKQIAKEFVSHKPERKHYFGIFNN